MVTNTIVNYNRYNDLLKQCTEEYGLNFILLKAQMVVESGGDPTMISPDGRKGLMQIPPSIWQYWGEGDPFDPKASIETFCRHMNFLINLLEEIPDLIERYKFALACFYDNQRDEVDRALCISRQSLGLPATHRAWKAAGEPKGSWQTWGYTSKFLDQTMPSHAQNTRQYVSRIFSTASKQTIG